eukprot:gene6325-2949_t
MGKETQHHLPAMPKASPVMATSVTISAIRNHRHTQTQPGTAIIIATIRAINRRKHIQQKHQKHSHSSHHSSTRSANPERTSITASTSGKTSSIRQGSRATRSIRRSRHK